MDQSMTSKVIPKILLVDDIYANRIAAIASLDDLDMDIIEAESGKQALELSLKHQYALILLDIQMPEMNGFEVAEFLRGVKQTRNTPIIFITAISKEEKYIFKGYETGAVDYLIKPVDPVILKSKVKIFLELENRRLEQEIIQKKLNKERERAEEKSNEFQAFANRVSHDLKGPLGIISAFSSMLKHDELSEREKTDLLDRIESNAKLSFNIIDGIYSLAELSTLEGTSNEEVLLQEHIQNYTEEYSDEFNEKNIKIKIECPHTIKLSLKQLPILVRNIINNAIKFKSPDRDQIIHIFTRESEKTISLCFEDNGPGVPESKRKKIFYAMERLVGSDIPGIGLGLSMVKRVMELHFGKVFVEDATQLEGAAFILEFPK